MTASRAVGRAEGAGRPDDGDAVALLRHGFVLVKAAVPAEVAVAAAGEADALLLRPFGGGHHPFSGMLDFPFPRAAAVLSRLVEGPFFRDFYTSVTGRSGEVYRAHVWSKFGGAATYAQDLHVDGNDHSLLAPADPGAPDQLVFFLYLTPVGASAGPTAVVPLEAFAQARNPTLQEAAALRAREVRVVADQGDCLVFTTGVAHRATELRGLGSQRTAVVVAVGPARAPWVGRKVWVTSENAGRWPVPRAPRPGTASDGGLAPKPAVRVPGLEDRFATGQFGGLAASAVLALDERVLDAVESAAGGEVMLCDCAVLGAAALRPGPLRLRLDRTHPDLPRTSRGGTAAWMAVCVRPGLAPSGSGQQAPPASGIVAEPAPAGAFGEALAPGDPAAVWGLTDQLVMSAPAGAGALIVAAYLPRSGRGACGLDWYSPIDGADWNELVSSLTARAFRALGAPGPEDPVWSPAVIAGTRRRYRRTDLPGTDAGPGPGLGST